MTALRNLLSEAHAHGLLRPLVGDALAMALAFGALALFWIATPGSSEHPSPATAAEDALATGGEG